MSEVDLEQIRRRCAMRRAEGQQTVAVSCSGLLELCQRVEDAERAAFCLKPTERALTPVIIPPGAAPGDDATGD